MPCQTYVPQFDSITNLQESIVNYILVGLETALSMYIFYNLVCLCYRYFSYTKNGIYQTIQFNMICLVTLISNRLVILAIILTRLCQVWFYHAKPYQSGNNSSQNFTNLLAQLTILFVNDIYLYGSTIWFHMIYQAERIKKFATIKKVIKIGGIYILNPIIAILIIYFHLFQQTSYSVPTLITIIIISLLVEAIFVYASLKLILYWDSFQFSGRFVNYFKYILYILLFVSLARIGIFASQLIFHFLHKNFRNFDYEKCQDIGADWAIIVFFYSFFVTILPIVLFVFLFKCEINIKKDQNLNMSTMLKSYINQ